MNLLQTRKGRLAAFSGLYLSEGLPQGFAAVALTLEFKRMGMDAAAIGAFAGTILLPWSWKFLAGPLVDNLRLRRFGPRKQWIVGAQTGMLATLGVAIACMPRATEDGVVGLALFTALMILHNVFAATQDVAIDALACNILEKDERGIANGVMFGSAQAGQAIGGAGVLMLKESTGDFGLATLLVPLLLTFILTGVITSIHEPRTGEDAEGQGGGGLTRAKERVAAYLLTAGKTIFGSLHGILGFMLAILPMGGMALSMVASTIIAPTLGMQDGEIARLNLISTAIWVPALWVVGYPISLADGLPCPFSAPSPCSLACGSAGNSSKRGGITHPTPSKGPGHGTTP